MSNFIKKPFLPHELPPQNINWKFLIPMIGEAHAGIARFDGLLSNLINPNVLLAPLTTKEAVISSRIEGTQASVEDVFEFEAGLFEEKSESIKQDVQEIVNYRKALITAEHELEHRAITVHLIKQMHYILMNNVRGKNKNSGEFRKIQNWIGNPGTPIEYARFIPPDPLLVDEYMEKLVNFMNEDYIDKIIQIALIHAQFEIIHPFLDGNGRIGRLLIPLFLYSKKLLSRPVFYISEYLEAHREEYNDKLLGVSESNDWQSWIEYFLKAVAVQSENSIQKAKKILNLYNELKEKFIDVTRSQFAILLLDAFFTKPVINSSMVFQLAKIQNRVTGNDLLNKLLDHDLIVLLKKGKGKKPAVYAIPKLINIVIGKDVI